MRRISATVADAADLRTVKCSLPVDVPSRHLAGRLAQLMHLPAVGTDDQPVLYGLIEKGGDLIASEATLDSAGIPDGAYLRLVPEIVAGETDAPEGAAPFGPAGAVPDIEILEEIDLAPESSSDRRPDIRIDAGIHQEIVRHASEDRYTECAGLLLGRVSNENGERVISVTAAAPAIGAHGTRATVRISLEAWEIMLRVRDADYADLRVLGWYHSHCGWGVFLSDLDVFIQRSFFAHPDMIAYVLDPTTGRDGFFYWQEGNISLRPSYGLVGSPRKVESLAGAVVRGRRPDLRDGVIAVLAAGLIWAGFLSFSATRPSPKRQAVAPPAKARTVVTVQPKSAAPQPKAPAPKPAPPPDKVYVMSRGDNPWIICDRFYDDGSLSDALARYNRISDLSAMQVGQEIRLPPKEVLRKLAGR